MRQAAQALLTLGPQHVLLKGGHLASNAAKREQVPDASASATAAGRFPMVDILASCGNPPCVVELASQAVDTPNTHGTGCTLASALAAHMARGMSVVQAALCAQRYVHACLQDSAALCIGSGIHGPMDHGAGLSRQRAVAPAAVDYRLYAVTDANLNNKHGRSLSSAVQAAVDGGATVIQIRCALPVAATADPFLSDLDCNFSV
jgi:hydroxymethylpyrimidine kinase / phosphomethylpyrimidine kinase / thiamine-phosphate diphosphorylase